MHRPRELAVQFRDFPEDHPFLALEWMSTLTLDRVQQRSSPANMDCATVTLEPKHCLKLSDEKAVFRTTLTPQGEPDEKASHTIVVKFAFGHDATEVLKTEARRYTCELKPLQGVVVPEFYGAYYLLAGDEKTGEYDDIVSCILLEDCGDCSRTEFYDRPLAERYVYTIRLRGLLDI